MVRAASHRNRLESLQAYRIAKAPLIGTGQKESCTPFKVAGAGYFEHPPVERFFTRGFRLLELLRRFEVTAHQR
jgi:hypothetical protein